MWRWSAYCCFQQSHLEYRRSYFFAVLQTTVFVEVTECAHNVPLHFAYPWDPHFLRKASLPFKPSNNAELEGITEVALFKAFFEKLKGDKDWEDFARDVLGRKIIFNHFFKAFD